MCPKNNLNVKRGVNIVLLMLWMCMNKRQHIVSRMWNIRVSVILHADMQCVSSSVLFLRAQWCLRKSTELELSVFFFCSSVYSCTFKASVKPKSLFGRKEVPISFISIWGCHHISNKTNGLSTDMCGCSACCCSLFMFNNGDELLRRWRNKYVNIFFVASWTEFA